MKLNGKVATGEWRAFYDYGAALNWIEDTTNTNCCNRMSMVKESDMDALDHEWPFESATIIIWLGWAQPEPEARFVGSEPTIRPTQVELVEIAASEGGSYDGKT